MGKKYDQTCREQNKDSLKTIHANKSKKNG